MDDGLLFATKTKDFVAIRDFLTECDCAHRWIRQSFEGDVLHVLKTEDAAMVAICFRLAPLPGRRQETSPP